MRVGVPTSHVLCQQDAENCQTWRNFLPQTVLHLQKKRRQARNEYDKTIQETEAMGEKQGSARKPPGPSKSHAFGPISGDRFRG